MSGTVVWFDRSVDAVASRELLEATCVVLVRCRITGNGFGFVDDVVAVDCQFDNTDMYGGFLYGNAFVRCGFVRSDLGATIMVTHFHACTFTDCHTLLNSPADEHEYLDVYFTDCTFVNSRVPRVQRGYPNGGESMCSRVESREHQLMRIDYIKRHTHDRVFDVARAISFGVPLLDHAVHAGREYTDSEACERDLEQGWPVLVDCVFAGVSISELGVSPVFVGCTWRQVVVNAGAFRAVFVECEFDDVEWQREFTNTRFVRCTFRRCRFVAGLDPRREDLDDGEFEVAFDDCVFELCNPPTLR